jgi:hypothetical protein
VIQPSKKKKSVRTQHLQNGLTYDEVILFIPHNNESILESTVRLAKQQEQKSSKKQEFYSESYVEDDDLDLYFTKGNEEEKAEYDSDYIEEERNWTRKKQEDEEIRDGLVSAARNNVSAPLIPTSSATTPYADPSKAAFPQLVSVSVVRNNEEAAISSSSSQILIVINEESKEFAKSFHKLIYDNCLKRNEEEISHYSDQLDALKYIHDIHILWTLLNLSFNFIINISKQFNTFIEERKTIMNELYSYDDDKRRRKGTEEDQPTQDTEGCKQQKKEFFLLKILFIIQQQQQLLEQFEKSGSDIFNKCYERFKKEMKIYQNMKNIRILNKKEIKRKLEQLNLQVGTLSLDMTHELRNNNKITEELHRLFEMTFNITVEDAVREEEEESEESDDEADDNDIRNEYEMSEDFPNIPTIDLTKEPLFKKPRIHDISAEAGTTIRKSSSITSSSGHIFSSDNKYETGKRKPRNKIAYIDEEEEEVEWDVDESKKTTKKEKNLILSKKNMTSSSEVSVKQFRQKMKIIINRKRHILSPSGRLEKDSTDNANVENQEFMDFLDSEDEFELLNVEKVVFKQRFRSIYESSQQRRNRKNSSYINEGDITVSGSVHNRRRSYNYPLRKNVSFSREYSNHSERVLLEYHDLAPSDSGFGINNPKHGKLWDHRFSDYLLDSSIPLYHQINREKTRKFGDSQLFDRNEEEPGLNEKDLDDTTIIVDNINQQITPLEFKELQFNQFFEFKSGSSSCLTSPFFSSASFKKFLCGDESSQSFSPLDILFPLWDSVSKQSSSSSSFLLLSFPEKWMKVETAMKQFLSMKWNSMATASSSFSSLKDTRSSFQFIEKVSSLFFCSQLEIFIKTKRNFFVSSTNDSTPSSLSSDVPIFNEIEEFLLYTDIVLRLVASFELSAFVFPDVNVAIHSISDLLNVLFSSADGKRKVSSDVLCLIFLFFQFQKYRWLMEITNRCFAFIHQILSSLISPSIDSSKEAANMYLIRLVNLLERVSTISCQQVLSEIFSFFHSSSSSFLLFCYSFLDSSSLFFSFPHIPHSLRTVDDLRSSKMVCFIQYLYSILYQTECLHKEFQKLSSSNKQWKELIILKENKLKNRYLLLKYYDRCNYHFNQCYLHSVGGRGGSTTEIDDINQKYLLHITGVRQYLVNSFSVDTTSASSLMSEITQLKKDLDQEEDLSIMKEKLAKLKKKQEAIHLLHLSGSGSSSSSYEFLWIMLIILSHCYYSINEEIKRKTVDNKATSVTVTLSKTVRIPGNWFLLKYILNQINQQISIIVEEGKKKIDSCSDTSSSSLSSLLGIDQLSFHLRLLFTSLKRLTKFSLFWENACDSSFDLFFSMITSSSLLDIFDIYSPLKSINEALLKSERSSKKQKEGSVYDLLKVKQQKLTEPVFDAKLLLLFCHEIYCQQFHKDNNDGKKAEEYHSHLHYRNELHHHLLLSVRYLFQTLQMDDPFQSYFFEDEEEKDVENEVMENEKRRNRDRATDFNCMNILSSFSLIFKEILINSMTTLSSSSNNDCTSTSSASLSVQFDYLSFRKLKSLIQRNNKKFLEIFLKKSSFSSGMLLLFLMKELIPLFSRKMIVEDMKLCSEIAKTFIETPLKPCFLDEIAVKNGLVVSMDLSEICQNQRSLLLLYNSLIVFSPLPIEMELKFPNKNNDPSSLSSQPSVENALLISQSEFLQLLNRQLETNEANLASLSPFLQFLSLLQRIFYQSFHDLSQCHFIEKMENVFYCSLSSSVMILSYWKKATCTKKQTNSDNQASVLSFRSDFSLSFLPFPLMIQLLDFMNFYFLSLVHPPQHQQSLLSSSKSLFRKPLAVTTPAIPVTPTPFEVFSSYLLISVTIVEMINDFIEREILSKLLPFLLSSSPNTKPDVALLLKLHSFLSSSLTSFLSIYSYYHSILFHSSFIVYYHSLVKKCHVYSDNITFIDVLSDEENKKNEQGMSDTGSNHFFSKKKLNQQYLNKGYFRQVNHYHSLYLITKVFSSFYHFNLLLSFLMKQYDFILFNNALLLNDEEGLLEKMKKLGILSTCSNIWKFFDFHPLSTSLPSTSTTVSVTTVDTNTSVVYDFMKFFFLKKIISIVALSIGGSVNVNNTSSETDRKEVFTYQTHLTPYLSDIFSLFISLSMIIQSKPEVASLMKLETVLDQLGEIVLMSTSNRGNNQPSNSVSVMTVTVLERTFIQCYTTCMQEERNVDFPSVTLLLLKCFNQQSMNCIFEFIKEKKGSLSLLELLVQNFVSNYESFVTRILR